MSGAGCDVGLWESPAPWDAWRAGDWPFCGIAGVGAGPGGLTWAPGLQPGQGQAGHQCRYGPDRLWVLGKKFQTINQRSEKPHPWSILHHLELRSIRIIKINMIFL